MGVVITKETGRQIPIRVTTMAWRDDPAISIATRMKMHSNGHLRSQETHFVVKSWFLTFLFLTPMLRAWTIACDLGR